MNTIINRLKTTIDEIEQMEQEYQEMECWIIYVWQWLDDDDRNEIIKNIGEPPTFIPLID